MYFPYGQAGLNECDLISSQEQRCFTLFNRETWFRPQTLYENLMIIKPQKPSGNAALVLIITAMQMDRETNTHLSLCCY